MTKLLMNARKSNPTIQDIGDEEALRQCSALVDRKMGISSGKRWRTKKKRFQCCLNPNYPHQFLYLRAILGHSGSTINPALKDKVLLPEDAKRCLPQALRSESSWRNGERLSGFRDWQSSCRVARANRDKAPSTSTSVVWKSRRAPGHAAELLSDWVHPATGTGARGSMLVDEGSLKDSGDVHQTVAW